MESWVRIVVVLCAIIALSVPSANGIVLEMLGFGAAGIVKGSIVATIQSAAAAGGGYIGTGLLGFGAAGIAKGSIAAGLQSAAAGGAGVGLVGAAVPVAVAGGVLLVGTAAYSRLQKKPDVLGYGAAAGIAKGSTSTVAALSTLQSTATSGAVMGAAIVVGVATAAYKTIQLAVKKTN